LRLKMLEDAEDAEDAIGMKGFPLAVNLNANPI
jgi:hypothetical protein